MKKYLLLILSFTFLISSIIHAQAPREPRHYSYPLEDNYNPLTIRVNTILMYRDDGTGNFNLNNPLERENFMDYLEVMNYTYANFVKPPTYEGCYKGTDFIEDAKVRFDFNIMQVNNSYYWDYLNSGAIPEEKKYVGFTPSERWYINSLDDSIAALNIPKAVNVYFTQNGKRFDDMVSKKGKGFDVSQNLGGQTPSHINLERSSQIHAPNIYPLFLFQYYQSTATRNLSWDKVKGWFIGHGLSHEMGHDFGLGHSNEHHKANACQYSMMSQKGTHKRNWLPPTEIKKIHYNLSTTNMMQFVTPESAYGATWFLKEDTNWDEPRRFYHNFEIAENKTLTITESIILPPQSYVKLNKNSKIIFKGKGKIVDAFGKEYKNFQKHKTSQIITQP